MDITLETKVAELLKFYPELENKLFELSPVFEKLKNPVLRRTVAKVTSLQQAAGVAGISPTLLIQELRYAAGVSEKGYDNIENETEEKEQSPVWFDEQKIKCIFDVRPIIESGQSPMQDILRLAAELNSDEIFQLITPFKPVPIIDILRSKGFDVWTQGNSTFFIK